MCAVLLPVALLKSTMRKEHTRTSTTTGEHLEPVLCEIVRQVHERVDQSRLEQFTFPRVDGFWQDLNAVLHELERLPETSFREWIGVILRLREARNELRLARFLFDVEEINPVRRLVLRNKAILQSKRILYEVLLTWPWNAKPLEGRPP